MLTTCNCRFLSPTVAFFFFKMIPAIMICQASDDFKTFFYMTKGQNYYPERYREKSASFPRGVEVKVRGAKK